MSEETKRMLAARRGGGGGGRRMGSRGAGGFGLRKHAAHHTVHVSRGAGALVTGYSLAYKQVGGDSPYLAAKSGRWSDFWNQLKQRTVPGNQTASGGPAAFYGTYGGLALAAIGPKAHRIPIVGGLVRALRFKSGRKTYAV